MMNDYLPVEKKVLTQLQRGVEPVSRPFQALEIPEADVLDLLTRAKKEGLLRRFGGIFDARRLGYKSVLCGLDVSQDQMEAAASIVTELPGVTHCYERRPLLEPRPYPPLWFTFALLHDKFDKGISALRTKLETRNSKLFQLPALRRFKIDVVFDLNTRNRDESFPGNSSPEINNEPFRVFSEEEKSLVRVLDQQIPLIERPFAAVANQIGQDEEWVLSTLQAWMRTGVLRRIGAVLYHRKAGFNVNAMCVWPVEADLLAAGRRLAARPEVTHCYQRPRLDCFPFDLYAMIHADGEDAVRNRFETIRSACGLQGGELFVSVREFKKSSMKYFREE